MEDGDINLLSAARRAEEGGRGSPLLGLIREDRCGWARTTADDRQLLIDDRRSSRGWWGFAKREQLLIGLHLYIDGYTYSHCYTTIYM